MKYNEQQRRGAYKHGWSQNVTAHSWYGMMARCYNTKNPRYKDYGGRGITVCERWHNIDNFMKDMGGRPDGRSLERRENDKGYEPDNCYWATPKEQANNRRIRKDSWRLRINERKTSE